MSDRETIRLRSDVAITPLTREHAENMCRWMRDPVVAVNLGLRSDPSIEKTIEWIDRALGDETVEAFAVLLGGRHVGNVVLDRIDHYLGAGRLSVYMGEADARGAGVATTGMFRLLQQGFDRIGLHKIWLTVHCRNYVAINAYARLGFVLEGILRDEFLLDGKRLDALYMGILLNDYKRLAVSEEAPPAVKQTSMRK